MSKKILIELSDEIAELLNKLSVNVNQKSEDFAKELIEEYISEQMQANIALERKNDSTIKRMTSEEIKKELGL